MQRALVTRKKPDCRGARKKTQRLITLLLNLPELRYGLRSVPIIQRLRQSFESEVRARWAYYQQKSEYRHLADSATPVWESFSEYLRGRLEPDSSNFRNELASFLLKRKQTIQRLKPLVRKCREEYSLGFPIPAWITTDEILSSNELLGLFTERRDSQPFTIEISYIPVYFGNNWQHTVYPRNGRKKTFPTGVFPDTSRRICIIDLLRPRSEIISELGMLVDDLRRLAKTSKAVISDRSRGPDPTLFTHYVKALQMRDRGITFKEMGRKLFRREDPEAAERKAELYVQNGILLISGQSHRIGER